MVWKLTTGLLGGQETHAYKIMELPTLRDGVAYAIAEIEKSDKSSAIRGSVTGPLQIGPISLLTAIATVGGNRYTIHAWHN